MKATIFISAALCSLLSMSSCKSTKEVEQTTLTETKMQQKEALLKEGYTAGTIIQTKDEGNCEWTIKAANGLVYESLTMKDEFKKNAMEVYFKFIPQRRMSKCSNASPIEITEIIEAN